MTEHAEMAERVADGAATTHCATAHVSTAHLATMSTARPPTTKLSMTEIETGPPMRPWAELVALVAREEARLGIGRGGVVSPSARLLALLSALRAVAGHEADRAEAATLAQARAELERDAARASLQVAEEKAELSKASRAAVEARLEADRTAFKAGLLGVLDALEARRRPRGSPRLAPAPPARRRAR